MPCPKYNVGIHHQTLRERWAVMVGCEAGFVNAPPLRPAAVIVISWGASLHYYEVYVRCPYFAGETLTLSLRETRRFAAYAQARWGHIFLAISLKG